MEDYDTGILVPYAAPNATQKPYAQFVPPSFLLCKGDLMTINNNILAYGLCNGVYTAPFNTPAPTSKQFNLPDIQAAENVPCLLFNQYGGAGFTALGAGLVGEIIFSLNSEWEDPAEVWIPCKGQLLAVTDKLSWLYETLGNKYGGTKNKTFRLPTLECAYTVTNAKKGITPKFYPHIRTSSNFYEPYLGMIAMVPDSGEPPRPGWWTPAKGQSVPQGGTQALEYLFELYGWAYSDGDGITTNFPNLTAPKGYTYYLATGGQMASSNNS